MGGWHLLRTDVGHGRAARAGPSHNPRLCPASHRLLEQGKDRGSEGCRAGRGCSRHRRGRAAVEASAHLPQVV